MAAAASPIAVVLMNMGGARLRSRRSSRFLYNLFNEPRPHPAAARLSVAAALRSAHGLARAGAHRARVLQAHRRALADQRDHAGTGGQSSPSGSTRAPAPRFATRATWRCATRRPTRATRSPPSAPPALPRSWACRFIRTTRRRRPARPLWELRRGLRRESRARRRRPGRDRPLARISSGVPRRALAAQVRRGLEQFAEAARPGVELLFSAHGLPETFIYKRREPYVKDLERTIAGVLKRLGKGSIRGACASRAAPARRAGSSRRRRTRSSPLAATGRTDVLAIPISDSSPTISRRSTRSTCCSAARRKSWGSISSAPRR